MRDFALEYPLPPHMHNVFFSLQTVTLLSLWIWGRLQKQLKLSRRNGFAYLIDICSLLSNNMCHPPTRSDDAINTKIDLKSRVTFQRTKRFRKTNLRKVIDTRKVHDRWKWIRNRYYTVIQSCTWDNRLFYNGEIWSTFIHMQMSACMYIRYGDCMEDWLFWHSVSRIIYRGRPH